jgi:Actin
MAKLAKLCKQRCSGTSIFSTFLYTFSYAFRVLESTQNAVLTSRNHRKYVLFTGLHVRRVRNEYPVLLSLFSGLPRHTYERTDQIIFDRFNMAAFSILDRHMAQLYAVGALSVVVIDIGDTVTDVTPIYEGFSLAGARATARVGTRHCERYLAHFLSNNTSVTGVLAELAIPRRAPRDAARARAVGVGGQSSACPSTASRCARRRTRA